MKKIIPFIALFVVMPAIAATPAGQGRRTTAAQMGAGQRAASVNQLNSMATLKVNYTAGTPTVNDNAGGNSNNSGNGNGVTPSNPTEQEPQKDMREKEKEACIRNNIGMGNTFVWASRYSNLNNYASMVEDVDEPANNTCFVRVEMKSDDSRISVADIPAKYFEMGNTITCGSWADEKMLEKRILDAKKSARTWGTVGGAVGGAALGVGAMELFGNKWINGSVEGQKAKNLSESDLLYSQLAVLKKDDNVKFNQIMSELRELKKECTDKVWAQNPDKKPEACSTIDYERLLGLK